MFKGFNLFLSKQYFVDKDFDIAELKRIGENHLKYQQTQYEEELKKYIVDEKIDGSKIQNAWFPEIEADIFLSHSGEDEELAYILAGWLHNTFGLKCFVDSGVWGYLDKLLRMMNSNLSHESMDENGTLLYDYECCNKVSQHVNAILSIAIQKMIDKTEVTILLNTEHSIPVYIGKELNATYSPWIYTELTCTQIVRQKPLMVYRDYLELFHQYECEKGLFESVQDIENSIISYEISLTHLIELNVNDLQEWQNNYEKADIYESEYALDSLYQFKCPKELEETRRNYSYEEVENLRKIYS